MSKQPPASPVSVIIPCYECAETLERAVASVAAQTQIPAQLILVDDCSGVNTRNMIQAIAGRYSEGWISIVSMDQNKGAASARNAGWAVATQTYIAFLDSDDAWHPEKIRLQVSYMHANPQVVLSGHAHKISTSKGLPAWALRKNGSDMKSRRVSKWSLLIANRFITPSAMLKRDIPHRFVERQRYMEDHMLWLNIVCSGAQVEWISLPLAAIYKRPYGQAGLSAQWLRMQLGDLGNYRRLFNQGQISRPQFFAFVAYSCAKFIRRVIIFGLMSIREKLG